MNDDIGQVDGPYCVICGGTPSEGHEPPCKATDFTDTHLSPDCNEGKHKACDMTAWCFAEDMSCVCDCMCHAEVQH